MFIEYYNGDASGDLVHLAGSEPLNALISNELEFSIEIYDGHPVGQRIISGYDKIDISYYINGRGVLELANDTPEDLEIFLSVGIVATGESLAPFGLTASTQLESNTEMSDYNGAN